VVILEEETSKARKESVHQQAERHALYIIIDAVFGLALGLGAFSLTDIPLRNGHDLFLAVSFFAFSYFVISMSWMALRPFFKEYIVYGSINGFLFITGFFIAILPVSMRLIMMQYLKQTSLAILEASLMLYPLCMAVISMNMGVFSFAFSKQSWKTIPWDDLTHLLSEGVGSFVMGIIFLISVFIPLERTLADVLPFNVLSKLPPVEWIPFKVVFWFLGGIALAGPAVLITNLILRFRRPKD